MKARSQRSHTDDLIRCRICGKWLCSTAWSHLRTHNITTDEYKQRFKLDYVLSNALRRRLSEVKGKHSTRYRPRSKKEIIAALRAHARREPRLTGGKLLNVDPSLYMQTRSLFGSWRTTAIAAGLRIPRKRKSWSKEAVIMALKQRHGAGRPISDRDVGTQCPPLYGAVQRYFGTYRKAIEAAGFDYSTVQKHRTWSRREIGQALRAWVGRHGPINTLALRETDTALEQAVVRTYGTPRKAARAFRLPYAARQEQWSAGKVVKAILSRKRAGGSIRAQDVNKDNSGLYAAARRHHGSWYSALKAAGIPCQRHSRRPT